MSTIDYDSDGPVYEYCVMKYKLKNKLYDPLFLEKENDDGIWPLFSAVFRCDHKLIKLLLENGADPNHLTNEGESLLTIVLNNNCSKETVKLFLDYGADPNIVGKKLRYVQNSEKRFLTPFEFAIINSSYDVVNLFLKYMVINDNDLNRKNILSYALERGYINLSVEMMTFGIKVSYEDSLYIVSHSLKLTKIFFSDKDINIDCPFYGNYLNYLLEVGIFYGNPSHQYNKSFSNEQFEIMNWLVKSGINLNKTNNKNENAISIAIKKLQFDAVCVILEHHNEINFVDILTKNISFQKSKLIKGSQQSILYKIFEVCSEHKQFEEISNDDKETILKFLLDNNFPKQFFTLLANKWKDMKDIIIDEINKVEKNINDACKLLESHGYIVKK